jgi:alpha-mannosidase
LATTASVRPIKSPLLRIEPPDVLALTLKTSEDGASSIVRLFGASGQDRPAKLTWPSTKAPKLWLSDLSERRISEINGEIGVAGWDLVTVRVDRA